MSYFNILQDQRGEKKDEMSRKSARIEKVIYIPLSDRV